MSNRFCIEEKQIFGNNILPDEVLEEVKKQGVEIRDDDDCHFDGFIENPNDLLTAIESATLRQVNSFAKKDDDLLRLSAFYKNGAYTLHLLNSGDMCNHIFYKQCYFSISNKIFLQPYFAVEAMREKCFFDWDTDRLEYKECVPKEQRKIKVTWG